MACGLQRAACAALADLLLGDRDLSGAAGALASPMANAAVDRADSPIADCDLSAPADALTPSPIDVADRADLPLAGCDLSAASEARAS